MSTDATDSTNDNDPVSGDPQYPFGLPMGTVRGFFALLICVFFWIVLLSPDAPNVKPLLSHYFLLALVFMAFASANGHGAPRGEAATLPWALRILFLGGTAAVAAYSINKYGLADFTTRVTPVYEEVKGWWVPFLGCTIGGFIGGLFLWYVLGGRSIVFQSIRAWLSVVAMVMLVIELGMFVASSSSEAFFHGWQAVEIAAVSAYFACRT